MKLIVDIPNSLYSNLNKITNGTSASQRILECVKRGTDIRKIEIWDSPMGKIVQPKGTFEAIYNDVEGEND